MAYKAVATTVSVLGVEFQAFKTEAGEVVFSQSSTADGLKVDRSSIVRLQKSKQLEVIQGKASTIVRLPVAHSVKPINVTTMSELVAMVSILAERGNDRAVAMQQASFAAILQAEVDRAFGVDREVQEYTSPAADMRKLVEERREKLRKVSGSLTNPILACNVYTENNLLIYGDGLTRDSYQGEDADVRHTQMSTLEAIQAGMKLAGMSVDDILDSSHEIIRTKFRGHTQAKIEATATM